jgi:vacuolar-type H+-ATPase subunit I/STV1
MSDNNVELDALTTASTTDASQQPPEQSTETVAELKARLGGQTRTVNKLQSEINRLNTEANQHVSLSEQLRQQLAIKEAEFQAKLKEAEQKESAIRTQYEEAKRLADKFAAEQEQQEFISRVNPALLPYSADLRPKSLFANDEEYTTYLARMATLYKVASPSYAVGATPAAPGKAAIADSSTESLSVAELIDRQWALSNINPRSRTPEQRAELDRVNRALGKKAVHQNY